MGSEKLEQGILRLRKTELCEDVFNNPVIKCLLNAIPAIGSGVDSAINDLIEKEYKKRLQRICEIIISDDCITSNMIKDVKDIISFAKMLDAVKRLIANDKVDYMARLYRNLILEKERGYDLYDEYLYRLGELSFREIEILHILDKLDLVIEDLNSNKQREDCVFDEARHLQIVHIEDKWLKFQDIMQQRFQIDSLDLQGYMQSISRSGFCVQYKVTDMPIRANSIYAVTKYYRNFADMIYK